MVEAEARREMPAGCAESHLEWGYLAVGTLGNTITLVRLYFPKLKRYPKDIGGGEEGGIPIINCLLTCAFVTSGTKHISAHSVQPSSHRVHAAATLKLSWNPVTLSDVDLFILLKSFL